MSTVALETFAVAATLPKKASLDATALETFGNVADLSKRRHQARWPSRSPRPSPPRRVGEGALGPGGPRELRGRRQVSWAASNLCVLSFCMRSPLSRRVLFANNLSADDAAVHCHGRCRSAISKNNVIIRSNVISLKIMLLLEVMSCLRSSMPQPVLPGPPSGTSPIAFILLRASSSSGANV